MAIGTILANGKPRGLGFAVATERGEPSRIALTANHVTFDARGRLYDGSSLRFRLADGREIPVERVERDEVGDLDVAVLFLREDVPGALAVGEAIKGESWELPWGPSLKDPYLLGDVDFLPRPYENTKGREPRVMQLREKGDVGGYKGYSGGPVVQRSTGAAIGVLVEGQYLRLPPSPASQNQPRVAAKILYAIPIRDVLDRFGLDAAEALPAVGRVLSVGVPLLPPHFVPRPSALAPLKQRLLADGADADLPGTPQALAVHALGGSGKSTLAAALAMDAGVVRRFPDGVLWGALGHQPDLLSLLSGWIQALGSRETYFTSVDAASAHLRILLRERAALLVVDDAWDPAHVRPFLAGGPCCRVLITTREVVVAEATGAARFELGDMTPEESLSLLRGRLGRELKESERQEALDVADAVGYLPLALELVAAHVADGIPWGELLADLSAEIARLESLDVPGAEDVSDEEDRKRLSLLASLHLSLRRLPEEKRRLFIWLGVTPEDAELASGMAATLWETDVRTAHDTLRYFRHKALLLDGTPTYRLHDVLHDVARRLLKVPEEPVRSGGLPGLGLTLPQAHAALLERYRAKTRNGLWHTLPDDNYVHSYLSWHMEKAGWRDEIHALLHEETPEGRNGWYEARESLGQTTGYMADVVGAWRLALEAYIPGEGHEGESNARAISLQCRYALITSTINSLASEVPPTLLAALVANEVWTPQQGLAYALRIADHHRAALALAKLLPLVEERDCEALADDVLAIAESLWHEDHRARVLVSLLSSAPERIPDYLLRAALSLVGALHPAHQQTVTLTQVAPHLPQRLLPTALGIARRIREPEEKVRALAVLAPRLPQAERAGVRRTLLRAARRTDAVPDAVEALAALAEDQPYKAHQSRVQALLDSLTTALAESGSASERDKALHAVIRFGRLVSYLPSEEQERALSLVLQAIEEAKFNQSSDSIRSALLEQVTATPPSLRTEVVRTARRIENSYERCLALIALVPHLPGEERDRVVREVVGLATQAIDTLQLWASRSERELLPELARLAPYVSQQMLGDMLRRARAIRDAPSRVRALAHLVPELAEEERGLVLEEALEAAEEARDVYHYFNHQQEALDTLAPLLPRQLLRRALVIAQALRDDGWRINGLVKLVPYLPEAERELAFRMVLAAARDYYEPWGRAEQIAAAAPSLPPSLRGEALALAMDIADPRPKVQALTALAATLEGGERRAVLAEARTASDTIADLPAKAEALASLAAVVPPGERETLVRTGLSVAGEIEDDRQYAKALAQLAPMLSHAERERLLEEVVETRYWSHHYADILETVVPLLPESLLRVVLKRIRWSSNDELHRAAQHLIRRLAELGSADEAYAWIRRLGVRRVGIGVLADVAARLPPHLLHKALAFALRHPVTHERDHALAELYFRISGLDGMEKALPGARQIRSPRWRANALARLASRMPSGEGWQVLQEVLAAAEESYLAGEVWSVEEDLASELPHHPNETVYAVWQDLHVRFVAKRRNQVTSLLYTLTPVIASLGGVEAARQSLRAIHDVGRWWP